MVLDRKKVSNIRANFEDTYIFSKDKVVLLEIIIIDNKVELETHIENHCKKASYKLCALQKLRKFLPVMQIKGLASCFINSQFNYYAIIWMFYSRKPKLRLKKIHK